LILEIFFIADYHPIQVCRHAVGAVENSFYRYFRARRSRNNIPAGLLSWVSYFAVRVNFDISGPIIGYGFISNDNHPLFEKNPWLRIPLWLVLTAPVLLALYAVLRPGGAERAGRMGADTGAYAGTLADTAGPGGQSGQCGGSGK
jgi:hypothetical protein